MLGTSGACKLSSEWEAMTTVICTSEKLKDLPRGNAAISIAGHAERLAAAADDVDTSCKHNE